MTSTVDTVDPAAAEAMEVSRVVISLLKGVVYQSESAQVWALLRRFQARVTDHMTVMGLDLVIDEAEGYAHLRQATFDEANIPRLVPRHRLSFRVSLLLALLRKRLAEFDATSSDTRLIITRDQIAELLRVHLPDSSNEVRLIGDVDTLIGKVDELGFLRQVKGQEATFEVRRIIKAYIDAQWLADFDARLQAYLASMDSDGEPRG
ncbi:MAG: DUF4194 domain-containing protein [Actinomycetota bacterium]|nr:DUF4194 domain-containing protein [Actinomycetota bacterium]